MVLAQFFIKLYFSMATYQSNLTIILMQPPKSVYGVNTPWRSGDLFHVAAAVELDYDLFLTFDERQRKVAKAAGLAVKF
jgi:predicted nucleic acid-binding protein